MCIMHVHVHSAPAKLLHHLFILKMSARKFLSGAAKRKLKKQKTEQESKHRRTLEDLGWKSNLTATTSQIDDSNDLSEMLEENELCNTSESENSTKENEDSSLSTSCGETSRDCDVTTAAVSNDPFTWDELTPDKKMMIVLKGPPQNPSVFPRDSTKCQFPNKIFCLNLPNGEEVPRDWLVWSPSAKGYLLFLLCYEGLQYHKA